MSFSLKQTISGRLKFPSIGVEMAGGEQEVVVTYDILSISINAEDLSCITSVQSSVEGCLYKGVTEFRFTYSGNGNPIEEAELSLKASIS
ncbi:hypothetical protein [Klebsiella pneumoniae]|uniref:hypothetical protein n=1 Tax=Klebsiella pneumoniae TaxID=573 RepID=UPI002929AAA1|nr:hypothetical protein [Klebsiella pneumoniae]HBR2046349.1 hypothetical protein [Klebsiella quasipneumoniae subsp. similipneumoniae]HEB4947006.1 hypothetical protein [Klebsiella quasipneumoniae]